MSEDGSVLASCPGQYCIRYDIDRRIVRISELGAQSLAEVDRYLVALTMAIGDVRRRDPQLRVLADLRNTPIRSLEAAERLRMTNKLMYRPGDRVALLVDSSLLKMQLRRNLVSELQEIFLSQNAAETGLTAHDGPSRGNLEDRITT